MMRKRIDTAHAGSRHRSGSLFFICFNQSFFMSHHFFPQPPKLPTNFIFRGVFFFFYKKKYIFCLVCLSYHHHHPPPLIHTSVYLRLVKRRKPNNLEGKKNKTTSARRQKEGKNCDRCLFSLGG